MNAQNLNQLEVSLLELEELEIDEIDVKNFPLPWNDDNSVDSSLFEDNKDYYH